MEKQDEMKVWLCLHCKHPIGSIFSDGDKSHFVRIKTKGGIIDITGGMISVLCSRCAGANALVDEEYGKLHDVPLTEVLLGKNFPSPIYGQGIDNRAKRYYNT